MDRLTRPHLVIAALVAACALAACSRSRVVVVEDNPSRSPRSARFVGQETLRLIKPGETTSEWLTRVMGPPVSSDHIASANQRVWRYEYERIDGAGGVTYRILAPDRPRNRIARVMHFEISGGVIQRWWME